MKINPKLTPLERLALVQLALTPNMSIPELLVACGARTPKYMNRFIALMTLTGELVESVDRNGVARYALSPGGLEDVLSQAVAK